TRSIQYPIQHSKRLEAVDWSFQELRGVDEPFGGVNLIFGGDFATNTSSVDPKLDPAAGSAYQQSLLKLGEGDLRSGLVKDSDIPFGKVFTSTSVKSSMDCTFSSIYGRLPELQSSTDRSQLGEYYRARSMSTPLNQFAKQVNKQCARLLNGGVSTSCNQMLDVNNGLANGTKLLIFDTQPKVLRVQVLDLLQE
ncbi:hypothetical protein PSHT_07743, partial [Puccinia striiformis]